GEPLTLAQDDWMEKNIDCAVMIKHALAERVDDKRAIAQDRVERQTVLSGFYFDSKSIFAGKEVPDFAGERSRNVHQCFTGLPAQELLMCSPEERVCQINDFL